MQDQSTPSPVPYGYCHCGCGQQTTIATKTSARFGHVKGEPMKYLLGHYRKRRDVPPPNPSGLCLCGCGEPTPLAKMTSAKLGLLAGHPIRYINGHDKRLTDSYTIDPHTGCWNWAGARDDKGYGLTTVDGRTRRAHIVFYERRHGPVPNGTELDHLCRNTGCVHPDHVEPVPHAVNCQRGANAKLTWEAVRDIRALQGVRSAPQLAQEYGVSAESIRNVWKCKTWWPDPDDQATR